MRKCRRRQERASLLVSCLPHRDRNDLSCPAFSLLSSFSSLLLAHHDLPSPVSSPFAFASCLPFRIHTANSVLLHNSCFCSIISTPAVVSYLPCSSIAHAPSSLLGGKQFMKQTDRNGWSSPNNRPATRLTPRLLIRPLGQASAEHL